MLAWLALPAPAAPTHAQIDAASWSVVSTASNDDTGDIAISRATVGGIECFRGSAKTDVAPSKLLAVVADVEGALKWSTAGVTEAKVLAKSGNQMSYYQYLDVPGWTMSADRYWFLGSTITDTPEQASLAWSRLDNGGAFGEIYTKFVADHPDAVEPPVNVGSWAFQRAGEATEIRYSICTLPGGSIPLAIQNAATRKTLPNTVGDVVREARKR